MAHKKCVICNESILDEQGVPYKGRCAHQKCFNIAIKTLQKDKTDKTIEKIKKNNRKVLKPKAELKEAMSEEEYTKKKHYFEYLRTLIVDEELSAKTYVLTDDYIKKYGFNYDSMYQTLYYLHEIIEKDLVGDVVGLIPYYHSEARRYFENIHRIEEVNRDVDMTQMYKEKVVKVKPRKRKIKQINIESIGNGVD